MELQTGDGSVREDYVVSHDLELQTGDGSVREDYVVSHDLELQTGDGSVREDCVVSSGLQCGLWTVSRQWLCRMHYVVSNVRRCGLWRCKQWMALLEGIALFQMLDGVVFGVVNSGWLY